MRGFIITLIIAFFLILIAGMIDTLSIHKQIETSCIDNNGYIIKGVTCYKQVIENPSARLYYDIILFSGIFSIFVTPLFLKMLDYFGVKGVWD